MQIIQAIIKFPEINLKNQSSGLKMGSALYRCFSVVCPVLTKPPSGFEPFREQSERNVSRAGF